MSETLKELEQFFLDLEAKSLATVAVLRGDDIPDNSNQDYYVDWRLVAKPTNPFACPIEISFVEPDAFGFTICSFAHLAKLLGLRWRQSNDLVVAGHEPIRMEAAAMLGMCQGIINEGVSVVFHRRFGALVSAVANVGAERLHSLHPFSLGSRGTYELQSWYAT